MQAIVDALLKYRGALGRETLQRYADWTNVNPNIPTDHMINSRVANNSQLPKILWVCVDQTCPIKPVNYQNIFYCPSNCPSYCPSAVNAYAVNNQFTTIVVYISAPYLQHKLNNKRLRTDYRQVIDNEISPFITHSRNPRIRVKFAMTFPNVIPQLSFEDLTGLCKYAKERYHIYFLNIGDDPKTMFNHFVAAENQRRSVF